MKNIKIQIKNLLKFMRKNIILFSININLKFRQCIQINESHMIGYKLHKCKKISKNKILSKFYGSCYWPEHWINSAKVKIFWVSNFQLKFNLYNLKLNFIQIQYEMINLRNSIFMVPFIYRIVDLIKILIFVLY